MVYCVQARLAFSTAARRDQVLADIESRITDRPRWDVSILEPASFRHGQNGIRVSLRFTSQIDADSLKSRVESFATGQRTPLIGSWLEVHECAHDVGAACTAFVRREW